MKFSLGQAAKETGKSKGTISKAIKTGRLSATKNDKGGWDIDAAELFRVYDKRNSATVDVNRSGEPRGDVERSSDIKALQAELETLKQERMRERRQFEQTIDDLRADRDQWRDQAKQTTSLLTHRQEQQASRVEERGRMARVWATLIGKKTAA